MSITFFRSDGWVKTTLGPAVPGAQIYVCNQPTDTSDVPPTNLAVIYSDNQGLMPITQPILTDGFGHYDFYAVSGTYTVVVVFGGTVQQVYPDQTLGAVIASGLLILNNPVVNPNFNDSIPAPPAGYVNVIWQVEGGYISACIPSAESGTSVTINGTPIVGPANFNNSIPAALPGFTNVEFQTDGEGNVSACVEIPVTSPSVNNQSGNYVAALSDNNNIVVMQDSLACTFTVPPNSSVAFPVGSTLTVIQNGAGQVTLTAGIGVTINTPSSFTTRTQYSTISVIQIAANVWIAAGDLS